MSQPQKKENKSSQIFTGTQGLIEDSQLDKKDKRIRKAVRLYYGNNQYNTQAQVAEEMGLTRRTVAKYLDSDRANAFERLFTDKEKHEIERWLQQQLGKHYDIAINAIALSEKRARENPEVSPQVLANSGLSLIKADERMASLLQEFNVLDKSGDQDHVEDDTEETRRELSEIYSKYHREKEEEGEKADASE